MAARSVLAAAVFAASAHANVVGWKVVQVPTLSTQSRLSLSAPLARNHSPPSQACGNHGHCSDLALLLQDMDALPAGAGWPVFGKTPTPDACAKACEAKSTVWVWGKGSLNW